MPEYAKGGDIAVIELRHPKVLWTLT